MNGYVDAQLNLIDFFVSVNVEAKANNLANFRKWIEYLR